MLNNNTKNAYEWFKDFNKSISEADIESIQFLLSELPFFETLEDVRLALDLTLDAEDILLNKRSELVRQQYLIKNTYNI